MDGQYRCRARVNPETALLLLRQQPLARGPIAGGDGSLVVVRPAAGVKPGHGASGVGR
jgi:hypothetical protein